MLDVQNVLIVCLIKVYVVNLIKLPFTPWNINKHSYIVGYLTTQIIEESAMTTPQTCLGYMPKEICPLNDFLPEIVLKFQNNLQHKRQDDNQKSSLWRCTIMLLLQTKQYVIKFWFSSHDTNTLTKIILFQTTKRPVFLHIIQRENTEWYSCYWI